MKQRNLTLSFKVGYRFDICLLYKMKKYNVRRVNSQINSKHRICFFVRSYSRMKTSNQKRTTNMTNAAQNMSFFLDIAR